MITVSGTHTRNTARQVSAEVSRPPIVGPSAAAIAEIPAIVPSVRPCSPGETEALRMATVAGSITAPPTPCATRAASSTPKSGATPATVEAPANSTTPTRKHRRRPSTSPSRPPSTSRPASGKRLAVITHWPKPARTSSPWTIAGSASGTAV